MESVYRHIGEIEWVHRFPINLVEKLNWWLGHVAPIFLLNLELIQNYFMGHDDVMSGNLNFPAKVFGKYREERSDGRTEGMLGLGDSVRMFKKYTNLLQTTKCVSAAFVGACSEILQFFSLVIARYFIPNSVLFLVIMGASGIPFFLINCSKANAERQRPAFDVRDQAISREHRVDRKSAKFASTR